MESGKLYIAMVGLPARGKSTLAKRLKENFSRDRISTKIFNNGDLRRTLIPNDTSYPKFFHPSNQEGVAFREKVAIMNMTRAKHFLSQKGSVAILDATNASLGRRQEILKRLNDHNLLFIECINNDNDILTASIRTKTKLPEFNHLNEAAAIDAFNRRIQYYELVYRPLKDEKNIIKVDSLNNCIIEEEVGEDIHYYDRIRDLLGTVTVKNLYLIRHGETYFNLENRIGGDSPLTEDGIRQAKALAEYFKTKKIPVIFTSNKKRTLQTAEPIRDLQEDCEIMPFDEFNEIDSGICECMSYEEIREKMPQVYYARKRDKYNYIYPDGEGYISMRGRVDRGIKKALYLSTDPDNIMIIGHRAVNRMILSHFLYRRQEEVPYTYIPQDKFYHIVSTQNRKLFQLKPYNQFKRKR